MIHLSEITAPAATTPTPTPEVSPAANLGIDALFADIHSSSKEDYICPRRQLVFTHNADTNRYGINLDRADGLTGYQFRTNSVFNKQLASKSAPGVTALARHLHHTGQQDLLCKVINEQLIRDDSGRAMVRTIQRGDGVRRARAIASDMFRPIDDDIIFDSLAPVLDAKRQEYITLGGRRTDLRTYAKFITRDPILSIGKREWHAGVIASNSEVGAGSFSLSAFISDSFCKNGIIFKKMEVANISYVHRGSRFTTDFGNILEDRFKAAELASIRALVADAVDTAFNSRHHDKLASFIEQSHQRLITGDVPTVLDKVAKDVKLTESERTSALLHMESDEPHQFGVQAAITRLAQDAKSYDRRIELEQAGGAVLTMTDAQWNRVADLKAA